MILSIGTTIRRLRTEQKITQDQLAAYLGVTPQAISRWEAGNGYPDIELLPPIALFFGITTDELLGIHEDERQARLKEIHRIIAEHNELGTGAEAIPQARQFTAEFPADEYVQKHLADTLCRANMWEENPDRTALEEAERIYLTLAERTADIDFRGHIIEALAALYAVGFKELKKAEAITEKLPSMRYSREEIRSMLASAADQSGGEVKHEYMQDYIDRLTDTLAMRITGYTIDHIPNNAERWDEKIAVFEKMIDLYRLVYGENMLFYHGRAAYLYRVIATYKIAQKNHEGTLDALSQMCTHAIRADTAKPGERFTSPFTDRLIYPEAGKDFDDLTVHNNAWYCLRKMEQSRYDPIREEERFTNILQTLTEKAK
ncbi:MAG: helix-turn-helix transcriptional regulator [Ruminococcaceae bacterium]|nr:helix-turn-helix transcriptional regulator [Oscillospiraceae bacterium]